MRDINNAVQEGHEIIDKNSRIDLTAHELVTFAERIQDGEDLRDIIYEAFLAGVAIGARNTK